MSQSKETSADARELRRRFAAAIRAARRELDHIPEALRGIDRVVQCYGDTQTDEEAEAFALLSSSDTEK